MDWNQPIAINFSNAPTALERLSLFIGHYDTRVYLTDAAYLDIGACSFGAFARISKLPMDHVGLIGRIGRSCEINENVEILAGGSHDHDRPVNLSMTVYSSLAGVSPDGMKPFAPVDIGSGVVISSGAKILPGVAIGDGAVIGAMSLVTKDVEPYAIVGGVPAKPIRKRKAAQPWWDFSAAYSLANMRNLQDLALSDGPHEWRQDRPRFVVRWSATGFDFRGFADGDTVRSLDEAPERVRSYVVQALQAERPYWLADCWA